MNDYDKEELKRLKMQVRFHCPRCGSQRWEVTGQPDFRYGNSAEYTVECLECHHVYGVPDISTG